MSPTAPTPVAEPAFALTPEIVEDVAASEATATVALIDLSPALAAPADHDPVSREQAEKQVADLLVGSFRETGFAVVAGHQVPRELLDAMAAVSRAFFALPLEEKLRVGFPSPEVIRGYEPVPAPDGSDREINLMESFLINQPSQVRDMAPGSAQERLWRWPNIWPDRPVELQGVFERYYRTMDALGARLLELVALGLDLPRDWFADKFDRHFSNLASNHYPPLDDTAEGQIRNRPHTDHGAMTLLYRPSEPGGLEVHAQGHWWRVGFEPGSLVLNVGDILDRWTNGQLPATPHRVLVPAGAAARQGRQSIAFFQQPNPDAPVAPAPQLPAAGGRDRVSLEAAGPHISHKELGSATVEALLGRRETSR